jgi:hypothetical protein
MSRVLLSWWRISRERGKVLRRRERAFRAWAQWAPRNRRLKASKRVLQAWTRQSTRSNFFRQWATAMHVSSLPLLSSPDLFPFVSHRVSSPVGLTLFVFFIKIFSSPKSCISVTLSWIVLVISCFSTVGKDGRLTGVVGITGRSPSSDIG